ncbi:MAG: AbrB/MazE/SpoVT family DNA-binding domain-containing protein [Pseudomonadota bacterium]
MQAKIVSIGNSQGVRIPKSLLEESGISPNQPVTLTVVDSTIVIAPAKNPREGWAEAFAKSGGELSAEDREWLESDLAESKDWTW